MTTMFNTILEAKVAARNKVNQAAIDLYPVLTKAIRPFIGQKISKIDCSPTKKFQSALPKLPNTTELSFRIWQGGYRLYVEVEARLLSKSRFWSPADKTGILARQTRSISIGRIEDCILMDLCEDLSKPRTNWTVSEILATRNYAKAARDKLRALENKLTHFGDHDNF